MGSEHGAGFSGRAHGVFQHGAALAGDDDGEHHGNEIRDAAARGHLTAEALVWTAAFGTEWRKASTLTGLFPPPAPEPIILKPADDEPPAPPFATTPEPSAAYDKSAPVSVNPFALLVASWYYMRNLIFGIAPLRRWLMLSLCVMMTLMAPLSENLRIADGKLPPKAEQYGLTTVLTTGLFAPDFDLTSQTFVNRLVADPLAILADPLRETAYALRSWKHTTQFFPAIAKIGAFALLMFLLWVWFYSRGTIMVIARIFSPDAPMYITWNAASKASAALFRGLLCVKIALYAVAGWGLYHDLARLAALPTDAPVPSAPVAVFLLRLCVFFAADAWLNSFTSDFVAPRMALASKTYSKAFISALLSLRLWYLGYLLALASFWTIVLFASAFALAVFGGGFIALLMLLKTPLSGALLALPLFVWRRIWTLEISFALNPELKHTAETQHAENE